MVVILSLLRVLHFLRRGWNVLQQMMTPILHQRSLEWTSDSYHTTHIIHFILFYTCSCCCCCSAAARLLVRGLPLGTVVAVTIPRGTDVDPITEKNNKIDTFISGHKLIKPLSLFSVTDFKLLAPTQSCNLWIECAPCMLEAHYYYEGVYKEQWITGEPLYNGHHWDPTFCPL